jgi:hypothetical protein
LTISGPGADGTGLECAENQGIPAVYTPFQTAITGDPEILQALDDNDGFPAGESPAENRTDAADPADDMPEEVILERDGIHYINSRFFNPQGETAKNLDQKFLDLVESVSPAPDPGAP